MKRTTTRFTPSPTTTPKELLQRRMSKNKLMKIPVNECENVQKDVPVKPPIKSKTCKQKCTERYRNVEDYGPDNPFYVPNRVRCFTKSQFTKRKVKPEPFIMTEPKTICDVDPLFYKVVEGRPVRSMQDRKVYLTNVRGIVQNRASAAYLNDQVLNIETLLLSDELSSYNEAYKLYHKTKNNFLTFVKQTFEEAKAFEKLADEKALELEKMTEQLEDLSSDYVRLKNELFVVCNTFDTLSRYRGFLKLLTPLWWQVKHDPAFEEKCGFFKQLFVEESHENIYEKSMITFKDMSSKMYFQKPEEMIQIFEDISSQCLNYMQIGSQTSKIVRPVLKCRDYLKIQVRDEIEEMEELVDMYKAHIDFMEKKEEAYMNSFNTLLMGAFQDLYSSRGSIRLFTCLQYSNYKILGNPEDPYDNAIVLMKQIELHYADVMMGFDHLDPKIVNKATKEAISRELVMMNKAYSAQRILRQSDILTRSLKASFEPPRYKRK